MLNLVAVSFVGGMSTSALAQHTPPNLCVADAQAQCSQGNWSLMGYATEASCVQDFSQYCSDGGGSGGFCFIIDNKLVCT
jgi:hypothetical protein